MANNVSFAWRCFQMEPDGVHANGQWPEANAQHHPDPPEKWHRQGFSKGWSDWRSGKKLLEEQVVARRAYSVVWCQPTQIYYVAREDRTQPKDPDHPEQWATLYCRHLKHGLWQLLDWGDARQHDLRCPEGFDEFLPGNFFMGIRPGQSCHFFGDLSLILGLLAMCPGNVDHIPRQIDQKFYFENRPRFKPWYESLDDNADAFGDPPMDRLRYPGRAIVMQTGIIKRDTGNNEKVITEWEEGLRGPMVSSRDPTEEEKRAWAVPRVGN